MKVAVVGMLEKQVQNAINGGDFRYLDIRTANKDGRSGSGVDALLKNVDRILVMTKFISHGATDALPRDKTTWVKGSVSSLRHHLEMLNTAAKLQGLTKHPVITPLETLEDYDMARSSPFDFSKMAEAETNAIVTYFKPQDMDAKNFIAAITQARGRLRHNHGLESEQTVSGGKGKIEVLIKKSIADARREEREKAELIAAAKASNSNPQVPAAQSAPLETAASAMSGVSFGESYPNARIIWQQVLGARMQPGLSMQQAVDDANLAARAFRELFP